MMTQFDRRGVLTSLAGGAAAAAVAPGIRKAALAKPESVMLPVHPGWLIAQRDGEECEQHAVKFWSMEWAPTHFAKHLPPHISRGLIAYHDFGARIGDVQAAVDPLDRAFENCARNWIEPAQLDRFTLKLDVGEEGLLPLLTSFAGKRGTAMRTALIDIDSGTISGGEMTRWQHILPAFVRCYDFVIGLCHFETRGLRQERAYFDRNFEESYFTKKILEPAALCDAVIFTSAGLIETDPGLCPSESTENLLGELVRRLGYALLERKILDRIVRVGETTQEPRFFALGSATLNASFEPLLHLQMMLNRQSAFVAGSFAPLAVDASPLFIATSRDDDLEQRTGMIDVLVRAASISGYALSPDKFATVQAQRYQASARRPGWLDLIALWPFKVDA
jgi:hypothetical protein